MASILDFSHSHSFLFRLIPSFVGSSAPSFEKTFRMSIYGLPLNLCTSTRTFALSLLTFNFSLEWLIFHNNMGNSNQQSNQEETSGAQVTDSYQDFLDSNPWTKPFLRLNFVSNKQSLSSSQAKYFPSFFVGKQFKRVYMSFASQSGKLPTVLLLHGTNQTIFNTQLVVQEDRQLRLLKFAIEQKIRLIVPQSRGYRIKRCSLYGWQPGSQDLAFLMTILQKQKQNINKLAVLGFSNGGMFSANLLIQYLTNQNIPFHVDLWANHMGGIQSSLFALQKIVYRRNAEVLITSCQRDENRYPCMRLQRILQKNCINCQFKLLPQQKHTFNRISFESFVTAFKRVLQ